MMSRDPAFQRRIDQALSKVQHAHGDVSRANNRLRRVVGEARQQGATWSEVGQAIGISQQGAQKRYGSPGERADLLEAREARRAARSAEKKAQADGADPWPDGTVQGTI